MTSKEFTDQVLPLKHKIFRFARRLMRVQPDAEDVTQEVFVRLWTRKDTLHSYRNLEAFAMTVTRNMCLDKLKSPKRKTADLSAAPEAETHHTPLRHTEQTDSMELINRIVATLPEKQQTIVQLRDIEGYEFQEIADVTGMTVNAIKVNLSRARQRMRTEISHAYAYGLEKS